jgi:hypothetical protein
MRKIKTGNTTTVSFEKRARIYRNMEQMMAKDPVDEDC